MTGRRPGHLTALLYRARTEGRSPVRQALAVALGLFIGASPLMGLHLALTLFFGWLFGLNRLKVYLAANISNPLFAPFLFAAEIQLGAWLRTGRVYTPSVLHEIRLRGLAIDILIGSVVVGLLLAVAGGLITFAVVRRRSKDPRVASLVAAAAERYLPAGIAAWELANGKLQMDPVYVQVLADGVLPQEGTLLDIGCGQGLMLSMLATARAEYLLGNWPDWPPPPLSLSLVGIELRARVARRARAALEGAATIETADIAAKDLPACTAVLMFDVLQMLAPDDQTRLLERVRAALCDRGVLVVREADSAGGWRFFLVKSGNRLRAMAEGRFRRRLYFATASQWEARLRAAGFRPERPARGGRGPMANFLLYARPADRNVANQLSGSPRVV
jgi:uncharacterized protein (DUF2062 family)